VCTGVLLFTLQQILCSSLYYHYANTIYTLSTIYYLLSTVHCTLYSLYPYPYPHRWCSMRKWTHLWTSWPTASKVPYYYYYYVLLLYMCMCVCPIIPLYLTPIRPLLCMCMRQPPTLLLTNPYCPLLWPLNIIPLFSNPPTPIPTQSPGIFGDGSSTALLPHYGRTPLGQLRTGNYTYIHTYNAVYAVHVYVSCTCMRCPHCPHSHY
jgi:hypothetical protein